MVIEGVAVAVVAYFLGSIPFGLVLTRVAGLGDIRNVGSGNIGATNVLRTGKKGLAALTLLCDALKGAAAVGLGCLIDPVLGQVAALVAVLGHMFPVWLKFRGGKGVATSIGVIAALHWPTALLAVLCWVPLIFVTRISSLTTLIVCFLVPFLLALFGHTEMVVLSVVLIGLIFYKHRENIRRLLNHTEPRVCHNDTSAPQ